jgi:hypothetical protein
MVEPLVGRPPPGLRQGLLGLRRIIVDDDVGTLPVNTPPTGVASRQPWAVVSNSRSGKSRGGNIRRYQPLISIRRQSRDNLSASSCPRVTLAMDGHR